MEPLEQFHMGAKCILRWLVLGVLHLEVRHFLKFFSNTGVIIDDILNWFYTFIL